MLEPDMSNLTVFIFFKKIEKKGTFYQIMELLKIMHD